MKHTLIAAITASMMAIGVHAAPTGFTDFVGFGDSLSDKGRFPEVLATQPPQDGSRFSDGPTWMEQLGQTFADRGGQNINLALGGATAGPNTASRAAGYAFAEGVNGPRDASDPDDIPFADLINFGAQVNSFLSRGFVATLDDNPFVTVLLGGNDFGGLPDNPTEAEIVTVGGTIIASLSAGITALAAADAKFDDFMVSNMGGFTNGPSLFNVPEALKQPTELATQAFNAALAGSMDALATNLGVNIEIFDLYATFDAVYDEGLAAGLIGDAACLPGGGVNNCANAGESAAYLYLDEIHPNSFIQTGMGDAAIAQLAGRIAPVPLPAGLPMLLAGLGAIAFMRKQPAA